MATRRQKDDEQESLIPDIRRTKPTLQVGCGDCTFFTRYQTYDKPCDQKGSVSSSTPCSRFVPYPKKLGDPATLRDVLRVLNRAKAPQLVAAAMLGAKRVRKLGLSLGEVVYLRVMGGDYLNNYASGVVCGSPGTRDSSQVVISGAQSFVAVVAPSSLMGREDWETKRDALIKKKKINDPEGGLRRISASESRPANLVAYEPPQLQGDVKRKARGPRSNFGGKKKPVVLSSGDSR